MHTFLLRVWSSDEEPAPVELHGVLERAGSHEPRPFRDGAELLSLLQAGLRSAAAEKDGSGQDTAGDTRPEKRLP